MAVLFLVGRPGALPLGAIHTIRQDVVAFTRRRRSGMESWRARWPQRAESDGHDSMAQAYQQRSTQSWVKISRLTGAAADAAQWVAPG